MLDFLFFSFFFLFQSSNWYKGIKFEWQYFENNILRKITGQMFSFKTYIINNDVPFKNKLQ